MINPRTQTVLIYDYGKFGVMLAQRLAREFGHVILYVPFEKEFPKELDFNVGIGFTDFEKCVDLWEGVEAADVVIMADLYQTSFQRHLKEMGKAVWGLGVAEEYETDRWMFREWLKAQNMPRAATQKIQGIPTLKKFLQENDNKYVKISAFRGIAETFKHENWIQTQPYIEELEHNLGLDSEEQEFIIDDEIDAVIELGVDTWTVDGKYPAICEWGLEIKDVGYIGKIDKYQDVPEQLRWVNDRLSPIFQKAGSRGFFASEVRITKDGTPYFTDFTARLPYPPTESLLENYHNIGSVICNGALGELVIPEPTDKYFAIARLSSEHSIDKWFPVQFDEKDKQWIKFPDATIKNGQLYVLPRRGDWDVVGSVVGHGKTAEEAVEDCQDRVERVKGFKLDNTAHFLQDGLETLDEAREVGIDF